MFNFINNYQDIYITICYNFIYIYSKIQLIIYPVYIYFLTHVNLLFNNNTNLEFIKNNKVICTANKNIYLKFLKINNHQLFIKYPTDFDFIIYTEPSNPSELNCIKNKIIIYNNSLLNTNFYNQIQKTDYKFMSIEVSAINDKSMDDVDIDFNINNTNFYMIHNIFKSVFLSYFLKKYYNKDINKNNIKLSIIDNNINKYVIMPNQELLLSKTNFSL
jgi:hypothetical protein